MLQISRFIAPEKKESIYWFWDLCMDRSRAVPWQLIM